MAIEVVMPQLGLTMSEGSVNRWLKPDGEAVKKGEMLFEVSTDKVEMEVEASDSGNLQILLEPGNVVPVGTVIAFLHSGGGRVAPAGMAANLVAPLPGETPPPAEGVPLVTLEADRILASPRARALASRLGIEIASVAAAHPGGRIVEADIQRAHDLLAAARPIAPPQESNGAAAPSLLTSAKIRKATAARMEESARNAPHFYLHSMADAERLYQLRSDLQPEIELRTGQRLTFTDLFVRALALTLRRNPEVNCSWQAAELIRWNDVNIGIAVQSADRLLVPVLRNADRMPLSEIAQARAGLVAKVREGRLALADLEEGRTTLSNLGPFGVDSFSPILNAHQSNILAVGRIAQRPCAHKGNVVVRWTVGLTFAFDHRAVDGVAGAKLLRTLVELVENPVRLLIDFN